LPEVKISVTKEVLSEVPLSTAEVKIQNIPEVLNPSKILTFASPVKRYMPATVTIKNKRAAFEYFLTEEFIAGIVLTGTEIKSLRDGKANLTDAFCAFEGDELFVKNLHISEYKYGTYSNHEPKRDRKLLLNRRELNKIISKTREKGLTIIPTLLFINEKGLAKIKIAIAKGKKLYDKRETLKTKDNRREIERHRE
jgi:SsrA-binding protein